LVGRNAAGVFAPIRPAAVTVWIWGAAHERSGCPDAAAAPVWTSARTVTAAARLRLTDTSDRRQAAETLACTHVALEITPQPTEDERAAIEAALAADAQEERPSLWAQELLPRREDEPEGS
jgi:hypothetical protein